MKQLLFIVLLIAVGCKQSGVTNEFPAFALVETELIEIENAQISLCFGGYGSSIDYNPADSCFYMLTDRGPNTDGDFPESKVFLYPKFSPTVGKFKLKKDSLVLIEKIVLKDWNRMPFSGLPNEKGDGVTGEHPYSLNQELLVNNRRGLDTEGLAVSSDGTLWISDEYGPFIMQFDKKGNILREMSPSKALPGYYSKRRPNRGMEGLAISKDNQKLFGIMQSPLYLPDESTKNKSINCRILEIDIKSGLCREYIYQMEDPKNVISEICFVNDSTLLVLERDSKFPKKGKGFKRVYQIGINSASDISQQQIELLSSEEMTKKRIQAVSKNLFVDIIEQIPGYRHDKPEGISLIGDSILCIANDDDFGITRDDKGEYVPKTDSNGMLDKTTVYFVKIKP